MQHLSVDRVDQGGATVPGADGGWRSEDYGTVGVRTEESGEFLSLDAVEGDRFHLPGLQEIAVELAVAVEGDEYVGFGADRSELGVGVQIEDQLLFLIV